MKRTKIVATIGPASSKKATIAKMLDAGMNVARINFSHGEKRSLAASVHRLRQVASAKNKNLAILGDLQGPKIRIGKVPNDSLMLAAGDELVFSADPVDESDESIIPFRYPTILQNIQPGAKLIMGDGEMQLEARERNGLRLNVVALVEGELGSRKGVNLPGTPIPLPSLTKKDRKDLQLIVDLQLDYVALSFVRSAEDIIGLKQALAEIGAKIPIIAKIEKSEAIDCLDAIIEAADGVMVARGDLGLDMPAYDVPFLQKAIIRKCNQAGKPVITATQMLQSMTKSPVPTRAEATDVANAILDGTDAVMLSNETAVGRYPVQSVQMMQKIALRTEEAFPFRDWFDRRRESVQTSINNIGDSISSASCAVAHQISAEAIVTTTVSGYTARQVARWRPKHRIVALTPSLDTMRRMSLVWGVESVHIMRFGTIDEMIDDIREPLLAAGFEIGQQVVITAGVPFGKAGLTNMLLVHEFV